MTLAFKMKYGKLKDQFAAITQENLLPPQGRPFRKPCETPVAGGRLCGHAQHDHHGSGEFSCKVKGCGCRQFTYLEE